MKNKLNFSKIVFLVIFSITINTACAQNWLEGLNNIAKGVSQVSNNLVKDKNAKAIIDATSKVIDAQTQARRSYYASSPSTTTWSSQKTPQTSTYTTSSVVEGELSFLVPEGSENVLEGQNVITVWEAKNLSGLSRVYLNSRRHDYYLGETQLTNNQLAFQIPRDLEASDDYRLLIKVIDNNGKVIKTCRSNKFSINK